MLFVELGTEERTESKKVEESKLYIRVQEVTVA